MARIETIRRELFTFGELDDSAKETARDWYRGCIDGDDINNDSDDRDTIAAILGIDFATRSVPLMNGRTRQEAKVWWSGFSSQGDGACWEGCYAYAKGAPAAIRAHAPLDVELHRIADELQAVQRRNFYRLQASSVHRGYYYHEMTMQIDVERSDGADFPTADEETVTELLRDFARWIYRQLEAQWDWLNADEQIDESIKCNGYEFDEQGNIA